MSLESRSYEGELTRLKEDVTAQIAALSAKLAVPVQSPRPLRTRVADGVENLVRRLHIPFQDRRTRTQLALSKTQDDLRILQGIRCLSITTNTADGQWDASLELEGGDWVSLGCSQVHERVGRSDWWRPEYRVSCNTKSVSEEVLLNTYVWVVEAALKVK